MTAQPLSGKGERNRKTNNPILSISGDFGVKQWFSKCGPYTNTISITWNLIRNANSRIIGAGLAVFISASPPGDFEAGSSMGITKVKTHSQEKPINTQSFVANNSILSKKKKKSHNTMIP